MSKNAQDTLANKEKLVADLQRVITDAEELMAATAHQTEGKVVELRERINENLRQARHKLLDAEDAIKEKTREMARATDDYVHEHPWRAVGTAAGMGNCRRPHIFSAGELRWINRPRRPTEAWVARWRALMWMARY